MMKISKSAPNLLKKAMRSFKSKTDALRAKLVIVASLRRRMAMVCAMSRQIHMLATSNGWNKQVMAEHNNTALTLRKATVMSKEPTGDKVHLCMFEVAMFEEDHHGYPDWTNSLFDDDNYSYNDEEDVEDDEHDDLDIDAFHETSVIDIIRSNREAEGLEFNMEDDIDEACDMFIRRCRRRMNLSF